MATISVCMVTRDDELFLERSLTPLYGVVDEILVVDLESGDNTVEIAKRFTKNVMVEHFQNDLSASRNIAVKMASMDWILYLDADEIVFKEEARSLKRFLDRASSDAYVMPTRNYTSNRRLMGWTSSTVMGGFEGYTLSKSIRLFRNFKGVGFRYPVIPTLLPTLQTIGARIEEIDDVVVHNLGHDPFRQLRLDWLETHVVENPQDIGNKYMLAALLMEKGELEGAKQHFGEIAKIDAKFRRTLTNLGTILMMQNRYDEAARVLMQAIEIDEKDVGAYNNLGVIFKMAKNLDKAEYMFKKAVHINPRDPRLFKSLALVFLDKHDEENARKVVKVGLSLHPKDLDLNGLKSRMG